MNKEDRKMLVMKAMQEPKTPGVFLITCKDSGNLYMGTSMTTEKAYNRHVSELKFGNHNCRKMQEDWNRYGEASFQFEILAKVPEDRIPDFSLLKKMEEKLF
ncbi:MAG: GIY-YIG nuclease family protein [Candidatus Cloacimonetes bacterium]|nr:GIY-YIG nuclease family protein [Candidatus Cloacimonadota bacterium]